MIRDPIVEEIHRIREKLLAECGGDLERLMDQLEAAERHETGRLVSEVPKPDGKPKRKRSVRQPGTKKRTTGRR